MPTMDTMISHWMLHDEQYAKPIVYLHSGASCRQRCLQSGALCSQEVIFCSFPSVVLLCNVLKQQPIEPADYNLCCWFLIEVGSTLV